MTMQNFIKNNRAELEQAIKAQLGRVPKTASCYCSQDGTDHYHEPQALTLKDLKEWVLNDEGLYRWARAEGVRI